MTNNNERHYLDLLAHIMENGRVKQDRTGTGTRSIFGTQLRFDLQEGFPLLTTKKVFTRGILHELLWFLNGDTNIQYLNDNDVHIWDAWADENGDLGPIYGKQWRRWEHYLRQEDMGLPDERKFITRAEFDQIKSVIHQIQNNPDSRRMIVNAWNVGEINQMKLPPCHVLFQFEVHDGKLSCQLYQRSADMFLGVPFNIASYSFLVHMIADICDLEVGEFIWTAGDCHIYENHIDQVKTQLERTIQHPPTFYLVKRGQKTIDDYCIDDFVIEKYNPHSSIKADVAV